MSDPIAKFRLSDEPRDFGLSCSVQGLTLAGVSLLARTATGFQPRPVSEIGRLISRAYRTDIHLADLMRGLDGVAKALNDGLTARAMIAAVLLRLPELDWEGAVRIAQADDALRKFDPDEPRDWRGRWVSGGNSGPSDAKDRSRASARGGRFPRPRPPLGLATNGSSEAELLDVGLNDKFHNEIQDALVEQLKADGLIVATEVNFVLDGTDKVARADIVAMKPGDPTTFTIIEVKTGLRSELSPGQSWVYPSLVHGGIVSSSDPKIDAFGFLRGEPLPPVSVRIWYEESPATERVIDTVPLIIPYDWHPPK